MRNPIYIKLFALVFITLISASAIQTVFRIIPEGRLTGSYYEQPLPVPNWDSLTAGVYQSDMNRFLDQHYGFRNEYTRLYNQLTYSLFKQSQGNGVIIGKNGYLYEDWFIGAHYGLDFIGDEKINLSLRWLRQVRSHLKKQGIELAVLIAPGKTDVFPEYIPDRLRKVPGRTNYEAYRHAFRSAGIPLLDFNQIFIDLKPSCSCPLFSKTGTHWSHFGARLATDSLSVFISKILGRPIPRITFTESHPMDSVAYPDNDLGQLMNLIFPLPNDPLCYPHMVIPDTSGFRLPETLVIGDSFFWEIYNLNLEGTLFKRLHYWYYNSTVYPESFTVNTNTRELVFPEAYRKNELILLIANPSNIQNLGWGFIERVFKEQIHPGWEREYRKMVDEYLQAIRNTPEWEAQIEKKASEAGIPKDSQMILDARYMVDQYLLNQDLL